MQDSANNRSTKGISTLKKKTQIEDNRKQNKTENRKQTYKQTNKQTRRCDVSMQFLLTADVDGMFRLNMKVKDSNETKWPLLAVRRQRRGKVL